MKSKLHVKKGDKVLVIAGDEKGKTGTILEAIPELGRVVVEGVAIHKKHQKPRREGQRGQIIDKQHSIVVSNVRLIESGSKSIIKKLKTSTKK